MLKAGKSGQSGAEIDQFQTAAKFRIQDHAQCAVPRDISTKSHKIQKKEAKFDVKVEQRSFASLWE